MIPSFYEFYNPVKIVSGKKALDNLPFELSQLGVKKPLIITDQGVKKAGLVKYVIKAFSESNITIGAIFDQTPPDSSVKVVNEIAGIYRKHNCDSFIAVGGGSVIDTTKGANIVITEDSDDLMKFMGADLLTKTMKPLIVIPTTSGTGSEVTVVAVISDTEKNVKMAFTSSYLYPKVAILDPRMTLTLPPHITSATGMDAMTHAMEAYYCLQKNPISDVYSFAAIKILSENLINVIKNPKDKNGRLALANASCMAGAAFSNSMVGMIHALGHATGGVCHVPHGVAMNIFLPHGLKYNMEKRGEYIAEMLLPLAGAEVYSKTPPEKRSEETIARIQAIQNELYDLTKLPRTLKEANVPKEKLGEIAQKAINDGSSALNPAEMDYDEALQVLNEAY